MALSPIERKAAFAYAVTMAGTTKTAAARDALGVSWTHLEAVLSETRDGSEDLMRRFAAYIDRSYEDVWVQPVPA